MKYLDIFIIIYIDNILIYLKNLNKYQRYIKIILDKLLNKGLRYKFEKYEFYKTEIDFFGFLIRTDDIKIDLLKVKTV